MCVQVRSGGRILGTLNVYGERGYRFDEGAVALAMSLADQAGIAIDNARLYAALKTRLERLETLTRLNRLISASLDMKQVLQVIARAAPSSSTWKSPRSGWPTIARGRSTWSGSRPRARICMRTTRCGPWSSIAA